MPEWFKLRGNGTWLYLADMDYRSAERQFEYIGKSGGEPLPVVSQPSAIDPYKNILVYRGIPKKRTPISTTTRASTRKTAAGG